MKRLLIALLLLAAARLFAAEDAVWQPTKTWVFAVGVLSFDKQGLATWPDEGRVDAVMIDAYKKRGVNPERIVFIKNKDATKQNISREFSGLLSKTRPGDTLIFYYAGHGGRDVHKAARPVSFVTYDTASTGTVQEVFTEIERGFKGSRALLTADCCHSGALAIEAARHANGKIGYAVLTSAHASSRSTGNWTFTQCLADLLNGSSAMDSNGDGKITFDEAARYCEAEMSFCESQLSCSATTGGFSKDTVFAQAAEKKPARVGERCEGQDQGQWWKAKILDAKDNQYFVTWIGWEKKFDAWVDGAKLRPFNPKIHADGTAVEVEWDKTWYAAKVMQSKLGLHQVHYDGYSDADDEWVPLARMRVKK